MGNLSKVKNENYVQIQGWMVNELKLKGNELLVYAIIYGFSQAENQSFTGSSSYIAGWLNVTKKTALDILKSLVSKGMITKKEVFRNDVKFCEYRAVTNLHQGGVKITPGVGKNLHQGGVEFTPNNIEYNKLDNIDYNTKDAFTYVNDNRYALKPEVYKGSGVKYSGKINYSEEQLKSHIYNTIDSIMQNENFMAGAKEPGGVNQCEELKKIILYFYQEYNRIFAERHPIMSHEAYETIVHNYLYPYGRNMEGVYDFDTYTALVDKYFEENYNVRGNYKGTIRKSLSHFMSGEIRNHLCNREGVFWERCDD